MLVAEAVEQQVDRRVDGEEEVGDDRRVVHPHRPRLGDVTFPEYLESKQKYFRFGEPKDNNELRAFPSLFFYILVFSTSIMKHM